MTAPNYTVQRKGLALKVSLGRKAGQKAEETQLAKTPAKRRAKATSGPVD